MNIRPEIRKLKDSIISTRRDIHQHPELGFQEFRTSALVAKRLKNAGLDVRTEVGKTGVTAVLRGDNPGPCIGLRADMDALPMQETSDIPYRSENDGIMHACGHDGHTAMLIGAAEALASMRSRLNGSVKFIFQPAEEGEGGARYMIEDGVLEGVDQIFGLHLWNYQDFGTIGIQPGPVMASADIFEISIRGIGGHGAAPQGTVDSIVVASHLIQAFQTIISRNTNPLESTVVTIGKIKGGSNFNIIAEETQLFGTSRAYTEENRQLIKTRMNEIIDGTAAAFGAEIKLQYEDGYPATSNHPDAARIVETAALKIAGSGVRKPFLSMGGEDFSYYIQKIPGSFAFIGSGPVDQPPMSVPHHCSHFNIEEDALLVGSSLFVQIIDDLLVQP